MTAVLAAAALSVIGVVVTAQAAAGAPPSGYVPMSALINGDSVTTSDGITDSSNNPISLEQYAAQRAGYTVTVVTGTQWDAMTAADFAKYQVLIIGDPDCSNIPTSVTDNAATWSSVVMGTSGQNTAVGNRTIVGTDPEFHFASGGGGAAPTDPSNPATAGAEHLVQSGITYAGGVSGATGVYFDTTCGDNANATETAVLNSLSAAGTGFSENASPPCGGSVQLIASNPVFASLTDNDIQGWGCSDHTTYPTYPTDWQPLAVATDTPTHPTCGTDPITNTTACGEAYVLVAGQGIVVTAPNLSLTPATGSDPVGGSHTVTATVTQSGSPLSGQAVAFQVTGQNAGVSGTCAPTTCLTDSNGQVTFTYQDTNGAGNDTINASTTIAGSTQHATAAETWTGSANHAPVANNATVSTPQDTPVGVTLTATDADSNPLTYSVVTGPAHGTLSGTAPSLTYTPNSGYTGPDSFTFKANDGTADSNVATVSITVTPVSGACTATPPSLDASVSANRRTAGSMLVSPVLTTSAGGELVLAFVQADGPRAPTQKVSSVTGAGLTWSLAARSNATWGTAEVWQAYASSVVTGKITAKLAKSGWDGSITVAAFKGAAAHTGATAVGAGKYGTPKATLTPNACGSLVWASAHDWTYDTVPVPVTGQTLVHSFIDHRVRDSFWTQQVSAPTEAGKAVTVADSAPRCDRWMMAAVEIPAAS
ncbi:MAG TPA: Ig-like domain-containing protein [Jatrophihabitans sp.]|nr:Ig-like domain-containing protein [Jatrophihabitans sp.]